MAQLPLAFRREAEKQNSADGEIKLFEITHPSLATPIRVASKGIVRISVDPVKYGVVSNGVTYEADELQDIWPDDTKDSPSRASLTLDNIANAMVKKARSITGELADVSIKIVMQSAPDVVVGQFTGLKIRSARGDENSVTFNLSTDAELDEPMNYIQGRDRSPGLHGTRSA